jgi:hypothetical protein
MAQGRGETRFAVAGISGFGLDRNFQTKQLSVT